MCRAEAKVVQTGELGHRRSVAQKTLFTDIDVDDDNVVDADVDDSVVSGAIKAVLPIIEVTIRLPDIGSRTTAARTTESSLTASFFQIQLQHLVFKNGFQGKEVHRHLQQEPG